MADASGRHAPRVTVGMPVYNGAKLLGLSIETILGQTFRDLELVISDNASTDASFAIAQSYAARDERVRVLRHPVNVGVTNNYSQLVHHARGEYFKWASASDLCDPTLIEKCVAALDAHPDVGLCCSRTRLFVGTPETGEEYDRDAQALADDPVERFWHVFVHTGLNNAINGLIRMTVLRETALIRPHYSSDITLLIEIALRSRIMELPECLFFRRFERESATALQDAHSKRRYHFPGVGAAMYFQHWKRCWGYVSAIRRAPLTASQRWRAARYVARLWYGALPGLWSDVKEAATALARRSSPDR
jgi:glycosyltransferase involved in cell wall biosynthesis